MSLLVTNPNTESLISQATVPLDTISVCAHDAGGNLADIHYTLIMNKLI